MIPGSVHFTYIPIVVWAGERLSRSHSSDSLQDGGLLDIAAWRPLQHIHEVSDEEVVLESGHPFLGQDGGLAAHWAGQGQAVSRNVVLQTPVTEQRADS